MNRNLEEFNQAFEGKICFIVGAGPSVHFQNLDLLKPHMSIAVNSGYLAVPEADFFISDDWASSCWSYFFNDLRQSNKTIALLYEDKLNHMRRMFGERAVLFHHRKGINIADKYNHSEYKHYIGETRTSVGSAIMVAHIMGCSKIALLGVDNCRYQGMRYFWQLPHSTSPYRNIPYKIPYRNDGVPLDRYRKCKIGGQGSDYDLVDISRTWNKFGQAVNKKCKVYNISELSILTVFPKMKLEEFVNE